MIPRRFEQALFGLVLSGLMSLIFSALSVAATFGLGPGFAAQWLKSWAVGWPLAFVVVTIVAPVARRIARAAVRSE